MAAVSCQSAYYGTMEKFGYAKREILVDRVEEARDEQKDAKEQFLSTLRALQGADASRAASSRTRYKKLNAEYDDCAEQAEDVREQIDSVEDVSDALFSEWKSEIGQYSDPTLKRKSEKTLEETKTRYRELVAVMRKARAAWSRC